MRSNAELAGELRAAAEAISQPQPSTAALCLEVAEKLDPQTQTETESAMDSIYHIEIERKGFLSWRWEVKEGSPNGLYVGIGYTSSKWFAQMQAKRKARKDSKDTVYGPKRKSFYYDPNPKGSDIKVPEPLNLKETPSPPEGQLPNPYECSICKAYNSDE